ncbi:hypothetical protein ASF17_01145 [Frigoribacterium sp. Leaf263]|nr:hypothetical protein ASF17_01145 [Frigoribacterium sp. Leaf263]
MIMKRVLTGVATAALGVVLLAGCGAMPGATGSSAPSTSPAASTSPTAVGSASPTPVPMPTATDVAVPPSIPTDCTDVVDRAAYEATMGDAPLNDPQQYGERPMGRVTPTAPPADADLRAVVDAAGVLRCGWRDPRADITGLGVDVALVDEATAEAYPGWLAGRREPVTESYLDGVAYDCSEAYEGTLCQYTTTHEMYGVEMADTVLVRDDVVITVSQANKPTDDLMGSIVSRIWG